MLLVIDHAGALGGAERFVAGLAMHLPRDRIEPWVCSTRQGDEYAIAELAAAGIPHVNIGRRAKWDVHRLSKLLAVLARNRFDVVHAHKFGSNVWCSLLGTATRVPVILAHEHNWSYSGDRLRAWLDGRVVGRLATRFIAVSEINRERMIALEGVPPRKIIVLPTGYIPHTIATSTDIRAELSIPSDAPVIGIAAGLRPEKALDVMLDAHARAAARLQSPHLVIAGDGPCKTELERQCVSLGTRDLVHFLGTRRDVDSILRGVDVGAMSSDWEGMPLFVFECMAARTPLVATAVGGLPEVVQDGKTGLLVTPQDPGALADALMTVLSAPELGRRMAAAAATRLGEFTIDAVAARFADLYERLAVEAGLT